MSRPRLAVAAVLAVAVATGCSAGVHAETSREHASIQGIDATLGTLTLNDVYVDPIPAASSGSASPAESPSVTTSPGGAPAGYLAAVIANAGTSADTLTGITGPQGSLITPSSTSGLTVAPGQTLAIVDPVTGSTGLTMTLSGLAGPLLVGQTIPLTFTFTDGGQINVEAPVYTNGYTSDITSPVPAPS